MIQLSKVKAATIAWYWHVGIYWAIYSRPNVCDCVRCCAKYHAARFSDPRSAAALKRSARNWAARKRAARDREQPSGPDRPCLDRVELLTLILFTLTATIL